MSRSYGDKGRIWFCYIVNVLVAYKFVINVDRKTLRSMCLSDTGSLFISEYLSSKVILVL